ncbi:MAG: MFS transporter, partial [Rubrivivax sp.]|nr:MFS transporter [Rubrivivax sp.]
AVLGCAAFAVATRLPGLIAARVLIGAGVAACLMAPLTCYRRLYTPAVQLRANSWMLMTGSLGMVASTVPVQLLLPTLGWRGLFWAVAALLALAMVGVAWLVPADPRPQPVPDAAAAATMHGGIGASPVGYRSIVRHPLFLRTAPLGFFLYGGLIAVQSLWAGPWLTRVGGWSAEQAAQGLLLINLAMLFTFMAWGAVMPRLMHRGIGAVRLMAWGLPLPLLLLFGNVMLGGAAGAVHWALWCVACSFVSVSQPAVGAAFPAALAGRALSAYNLVIFAGVFCIQWGIGLLIDGLRALGLTEADAFRLAFTAFGLCCVMAYLWFLRAGRSGADNPA